MDGLYVMQIINSESIRVHRIWALRNGSSTQYLR